MNDVVDQEKGMIAGPLKIGIIPTVMPYSFADVFKYFFKKVSFARSNH
jgi:hypothetical protein